MASKSITGLGSETTKAKRSTENVAIDGIATRRWQAEAFGPTTASAQCTYLEAPQLPPAYSFITIIIFSIFPSSIKGTITTSVPFASKSRNKHSIHKIPTPR